MEPKVAGSRRLHRKLTETDFIAFDLETTGLFPVVNQIVEFGAVRFRLDGRERHCRRPGEIGHLGDHDGTSCGLDHKAAKC